MKFKTCLLACLLLVAGNASAAKNNFLKKVFENLTYGSIDKSLATVTFKNKPCMVFKTDKAINIFDVNGFCVKKMKVWPDDWVHSIDAKEDFVIVGNKKGQIKRFDFETGCCIHTWQAHEKGLIQGNVVVKIVNINDELYIVSAAEDGTIRIWDMNGRCKKVFTLEDNNIVFNLLVTHNLGKGMLEIHAELSQHVNAKFYWNYKEEEHYNKEEYYYHGGDTKLLLPDQAFVVGEKGTTVSPEIFIVDYKKRKNFKCVDMEYTFGGDYNSELGYICSIVSVPKTNYLFIFFEYGNVVLFDWKNKEIVDKFSMGNKKKVASGGLLPFEKKLYAIVGFEDGTVNTKQIFPSDDTNSIVKE